MATLCCNADWLVIVIVTLPALALSFFVLNLSCCGSASSDSCCPLPLVDEAAPPELVAAPGELVVLLSLEDPQPATASSAKTVKMRSRFMRRSLTRRRDQKLQQRSLRVQAVFRVVPDRRALAVEDRLGDLLAGVCRQAVERDRLWTRPLEQRFVEPVRGEQGAPLAGRALVVAHADPDVRVDRVSARCGLGGIGRHGDVPV